MPFAMLLCSTVWLWISASLVTHFDQRNIGKCHANKRQKNNCTTGPVFFCTCSFSMRILGLVCWKLRYTEISKTHRSSCSQSISWHPQTCEQCQPRTAELPNQPLANSILGIGTCLLWNALTFCGYLLCSTIEAIDNWYYKSRERCKYVKTQCNITTYTPKLLKWKIRKT